MRRCTRLVTSAAAISLATSAVAVSSMSPVWAAPGTTTVPLRQYLRDCDFTMVPNVGGTGDGTATAVIQHGGSSASADVQLIRGKPDTRYDVGLIQTPRPSSSPCGPGDPGTAYVSLNTDGAGAGRVTVQDAIDQGTTGLWVVLRRPSEHSQSPAEFYTSDYLLPI